MKLIHRGGSAHGVRASIHDLRLLAPADVERAPAPLPRRPRAIPDRQGARTGRWRCRREARSGRARRTPFDDVGRGPAAARPTIGRSFQETLVALSGAGEKRTSLGLATAICDAAARTSGGVDRALESATFDLAVSFRGMALRRRAGRGAMSALGSSGCWECLLLGGSSDMRAWLPAFRTPRMGLRIVELGGMSQRFRRR